MLKTKEEIINWLEKYGVKNYTINDDLTVDVDGGVDLEGRGFEKIDIQFGKVSQHFDCSFNQLMSLVGSPQKVGGDFTCSENKLNNLVGGPKEIGENYFCFRNNLISLLGSPIRIGGNFNCSYNRLETLEFYPKEIDGSFLCGNNNLQTLKFIPEVVGGYFHCSNNDGLGELQNVSNLRELKSILLNEDLNNSLKNNKVEKKNIKI